MNLKHIRRPFHLLITFIPVICLLTLLYQLTHTSHVEAAIIDYSPTSVEQVSPPANVCEGEFENQYFIRAFDELQRVTLPQTIHVDITQPGTYSDVLELTPGNIPAGTTVSSHYLHADPDTSYRVSFMGSVTFDAPIIGIVVLDASLANTNAALGASETTYPTGSQGLELSGEAGDDYVIVSNDRRTITVHFRVSDQLDQIRVITLDNPLLARMVWNDRPECPFCSVQTSVGQGGGPINTQNGNLSYQKTDLSIPIRGDSLTFHRSYASDRVGVYTGTIGAGWTHNYEMHLAFTNVAISNTVEFQAPGGSRLPFYMVTGTITTYIPYGGVTAALSYITPTYVLTAFNQTVYTFNTQGLLQQQADALGNVITFTYDTNDRLIQAAQDERYLSYTYDTNGYLTTVSDHTDRQITLGYLDGNLTAVTNTLGFSTTYVYSGTTHLLTNVTDPSGRTVEETAYVDMGDGDYRAYRQWDGTGRLMVDINYTLTNTHLITENGVVMTHTYDARNTLTAITYACPPDTAGCGQTQGTGYDHNFKHNDVEDANGHETTLHWNPGGSNLEQITDALTNTTQMGYDAENNLTQIVNARDYTTTFAYHDTLPTFRTRMTDTLGHVTLFTPTIAGVDGSIGGLLKAQQDPDGRLATYAYNAYGQITQIVQAAGTTEAITTTYGYDEVGRPITVTQISASESHTTLSVYDDGDHLLATINNWTGSNPANWAADCDTSAGSRDTDVCTRYGYDAAGRLISTTNTLSQTRLTFYDDAGRAYLDVNNYDGTTYTNPQTDLCDFASPDPVYNLCSLTEYDGYGRVVTMTNSLGQANVTEYDAMGRVSRTVTNWEDGIFSATASDQDIETRMQYDAVGNTLIVTDTMGRMTRSFYDELNRVAGTITNWDGSTTLTSCATLPMERDENICTQYAYDEVGNTLIVTDTLGRMTRSFYDELNRVATMVTNWNPTTLTTPADCVLSADNEAIENICTLYGYDGAGHLITTTNALNQTTLTVYDAANRPVVQVANWDKETTILSDGTGCATAVDAVQNVCTRTEYDSLGRRVSTINPLGHVTEFAYDGLGRILTTTHYLDSSPITMIQTYDALGNRLSSTDANGHTTSYTYDSLNRLATTISPEGVAITQTYNAAGWVLTTTNNLGYETVTGYDALGRRTAIVDPEDNTTTYAYDALGNQVRLVNAAGITTTYSYDNLNRLVTVIENDVPGTNPTSETDVLTQYSYDALSNQTHITNALGITTTTTVYDSLNRPVLVMDALGNQTQVQYNALGYRLVMTDGNEAVTQYTYDDLNRLTATAYLSDSETVQVTYDVLGNRTAMTDSLGVSTYDYDDLSRLITVTNPLTGTVIYEYDAAGNRTHLTYPDSKVVTYTYDSDNRLTLVDNWGPGMTTYAYDEVGRLITTTLPNGIVSVNMYDAANRLTQLAHFSDSAALLAQFDYELDNLGNRVVTTETLRVPSGSSLPDTQPDASAAATAVFVAPIFPNVDTLTGSSLQTILIQYDYDPLQRLTNATYSGILSATYDYRYDPVGNMTIYTETVDMTTTVISRTFNAANQLQTSFDGSKTITYTYDSNGNLTRAIEATVPWEVGNSYFYDQRNLVTAVYKLGSIIGTEAIYTYDGNGDRVRQENPLDSTTITYTNDVLGMTQVLLADGGITTTAYLYGLDLIGQDDDSTPLLFLADGLGSVRLEMGISGGNALLVYTPYGKLLAQLGESGTVYGFTGEQEDIATGLVYLRARYYNPYLNQFQSRDPFPGYTKLPQSQNGFSYVHDNPVNYTDPSGKILDPLTNFGRGIIIHRMIQAKYAADRPTNIYNFEYEIPYASLHGDIGAKLCKQSGGQPFYAIVCNNPNVGSIIDNANGHADIVDWTESSLYEIKSIRTPKPIGILTAQWYILNYNEAVGWEIGLPLFPGQGFGPTQIVGTDPANPGSWIFAEQDVPGLITYWERPKDRTQPETVPVYVYEWNPGLQTVQERPAYAVATPSYGTCGELADEAFWIAAGGYLLWNLKGCALGPAGCAVDLITPVP